MGLFALNNLSLVTHVSLQHHKISPGGLLPVYNCVFAAMAGNACDQIINSAWHTQWQRVHGGAPLPAAKLTLVSWAIFLHILLCIRKSYRPVSCSMLGNSGAVPLRVEPWPAGCVALPAPEAIMKPPGELPGAEDCLSDEKSQHNPDNFRFTHLIRLSASLLPWTAARAIVVNTFGSRVAGLPFSCAPLAIPLSRGPPGARGGYTLEVHRGRARANHSSLLFSCCNRQRYMKTYSPTTCLLAGAERGVCIRSNITGESSSTQAHCCSAAPPHRGCISAHHREAGRRGTRSPVVCFNTISYSPLL